WSHPVTARSATTTMPRAPTAGVGKPPMDEIALGFDSARWLVELLLRCLRSGVWADPTVIASAPVAPIVVVAAKEARPGVGAEMVEMSAIKTMAAGHATNVTTHATDVTSA